MLQVGEAREHVDRKIVQVAFRQVPASRENICSVLFVIPKRSITILLTLIVSLSCFTLSTVNLVLHQASRQYNVTVDLYYSRHALGHGRIREIGRNSGPYKPQRFFRPVKVKGHAPIPLGGNLII